MNTQLKRVFQHCFEQIGGDTNEDVKFILDSRGKLVTRANMFPEAAWAILVSGISRKGAATHWDRASEAGFTWDYAKTARWTQADWDEFFAKLYPDGVSERGGKKWGAIRFLAESLDEFPDESAFQTTLFGGKKKACALNRDDIGNLYAMGLPYIGYANSQYIVRNMGGESIKCDRWIMALLRHFRMTEVQLTRALTRLEISLSLFDVVIWAYCERFIKEVAAFGKHFNKIMTILNGRLLAV